MVSLVGRLRLYLRLLGRVPAHRSRGAESVGRCSRDALPLSPPSASKTFRYCVILLLLHIFYALNPEDTGDFVQSAHVTYAALCGPSRPIETTMALRESGLGVSDAAITHCSVYASAAAFTAPRCSLERLETTHVARKQRLLAHPALTSAASTRRGMLRLSDAGATDPIRSLLSQAPRGPSQLAIRVAQPVLETQPVPNLQSRSIVAAGWARSTVPFCADSHPRV